MHSNPSLIKTSPFHYLSIKAIFSSSSTFNFVETLILFYKSANSNHVTFPPTPNLTEMKERKKTGHKTWKHSQKLLLTFCHLSGNPPSVFLSQIPFQSLSQPELSQFGDADLVITWQQGLEIMQGKKKLKVWYFCIDKHAFSALDITQHVSQWRCEYDRERRGFEVETVWFHGCSKKILEKSSRKPLFSTSDREKMGLMKTCCERFGGISRACVDVSLQNLNLSRRQSYTNR